MPKKITGNSKKTITSICWDDETDAQVKDLMTRYGNKSLAVGNAIRMLYFFHHPEEARKAAEAAGIV